MQMLNGKNVIFAKQSNYKSALSIPNGFITVIQSSINSNCEMVFSYSRYSLFGQDADVKLFFFFLILDIIFLWEKS